MPMLACLKCNNFEGIKTVDYLVNALFFLQDSSMSVVDTTRVKLHSLEGDDDRSVRSSTFPPSPPSSQHMSPSGSSTVSNREGDGKDADDRVNISDGASPIGVRFSQAAPREPLDTTIADLNVRRVTRREDDQESVQSSQVTEDDSSESGLREPCGIILKR